MKNFKVNNIMAVLMRCITVAVKAYWLAEEMSPEALASLLVEIRTLLKK